MIVDFDKIENPRLKKAAEVILGYVYDVDLRGGSLAVECADKLSNDQLINGIYRDIALLNGQLCLNGQEFSYYKDSMMEQDIDTTMRDIISGLLLVKIKNMESKSEENKEKENKEKEKYMIQAMNEMCESVNSFIHECWDDVEKVGTDFHADAEKMTLEEAAKDLDYYNKCRSANEKIEPTTIMDIVIAAAIVFKKLEK